MKQYQSEKCIFPSCDHKPLAHDLCSGHYKQYMKGKNMKPLRKKAANNTYNDLCCVEGCIQEAVVKEMCQSHYDKVRRIIKRKNKEEPFIPNED